MYTGYPYARDIPMYESLVVIDFGRGFANRVKTFLSVLGLIVVFENFISFSLG